MFGERRNWKWAIGLAASITLVPLLLPLLGVIPPLLSYEDGKMIVTSIGFDLTITRLFAPLLAGVAVTMIPEEGEIEALAAALADPGGFSLVKLTPAHLEMMNQLLPADKAAASTRALVIGGEALSWETLAFWRKNAPGTRLINEYGPTEATIAATNAWRLLFSGAATVLPFRSSNERIDGWTNNSQQPVWMPPSTTIGAPASKLITCAALSFCARSIPPAASASLGPSASGVFTYWTSVNPSAFSNASATYSGAKHVIGES